MQKKQKPYEKPGVILEKRPEALAADCGSGDNNVYLGGNDCKAAGACTILYS